MKVEFQVVIRPEMALPLTLTRSEAKELYDALHAEFGDFDQARELSQLARESVRRELRLAELEAEARALRFRFAEGLPTLEQQLAKSDHCVIGLQNDVTCGPSLQDDIEAMIAARKNDPNHIVGANKMVDDAEWAGLEEFKPVEPSSTPEPPAEPEKAPEAHAPSNERQVRSPRTNETDAEKCVRLWMQYRAKYPKATDSEIVTRVRSHVKRLTNDEVRRILRECGLAVADPTPRREVILNARAESPRGNPPKHIGPRPPLGYRIVDAEAWKASAPLLNESEIRELAEGGLARIGLAVAA